MKVITRCLQCGSLNTCPILHGLVGLDDQLNDDLEAGKVHLGDCMVSDENPEKYCNNCEAEF